MAGSLVYIQPSPIINPEQFVYENSCLLDVVVVLLSHKLFFLFRRTWRFDLHGSHQVKIPSFEATFGRVQFRTSEETF